MVGTSVGFQFRNEQFFARSRKSRGRAEAYIWYVAQAILQIDTEIAEKGHFWMENSSLRSQLARPARPGATTLELMSVPVIPVWARGATEVGQCLGKKNPVWARE